MSKYQLLHSAAIAISGSLIGLMLVSHLEGQTGHLTDLAIGMLVVGGAWHLRALLRIARG